MRLGTFFAIHVIAVCRRSWNLKLTSPARWQAPAKTCSSAQRAMGNTRPSLDRERPAKTSIALLLTGTVRGRPFFVIGKMLCVGLY